MKQEVELPEGAEATYKKGILNIEHDGQELEKKLDHAQVDVKIEDGSIVFQTDNQNKGIQSIVKTFSSHTKNMLEGMKNPHTYKLKAVYAHFPMTVKQKGNEIVVENFMGERHPRRAKIDENVDVDVQEEEITVKSSDKEAAAQTAARIEQLSKKGNRDPRTFQDGIYITEGDL